MELEEIRIMADLHRIHYKVFELYNTVNLVRRRYTEQQLVHGMAAEELQETVEKLAPVFNWMIRVQAEMKEGKAQAAPS